MATSSTPAWAAQHAGVLGQGDAMAGAASINQMLGTHPESPIYGGNTVVTPNGQGAAAWALQLSTLDIDQPFTMSGTAIGRLQVPVLPVGNGADLNVSLCADNAGLPGNVITRTRIPAAWITQLAATNGLDAAGPLATAPGNALFYSGWQSVPWSPPATGATGGLATAQLAQSGNYLVFAGGVNAANGNSSATVAVITALGNATVSGTVAGPQLPQPLLSGGFVVTPDSLCYLGGVNINGASSTVQSTVYLASWNSSTGAIGSWSVQTALPTALVSPGAAAYGPTDTVYVVGGSTNYAPETAVVSTVYHATISGGQITAWAAGPPLPAAVADPTVAVVGLWLICAGGFNASGNGTTGVYYAPINPTTGVPGSWQTAPSIPSGLGIYVEGIAAVSDSALAWPQAFSTSTGFATQDTLTLTWTANGPGVWTHQVGPITVLNQDQVTAMVATGNGSYQIFNFQDAAYITASVLTVPMISVPLPATGLTNNATYHVLLQQPNGDLNDYLKIATDLDALPGNPTLKTSPKGTWTWTTATPTGTAVPIRVYDNSNGTSSATGTAGNNQVRHTWEDSGARIGTLMRATTPDQRLIGILEAASSPAALNSNSGFESGVPPWTGSNSAIAQSSTQAYEGRYSLLLTPTGGFTTAAALSEKVPCLPNVGYTVKAWAYSPGGYGNVNTQVNWYNAAGTFLSSSSTAFNVPSAAWTDITAKFTAPANAYQAQIALQEAGSPSSGNTIYFDVVWIYETAGGPQLATVAQITYAGTWPGSGLWPPTGVTVLG